MLRSHLFLHLCRFLCVVASVAENGWHQQTRVQHELDALATKLDQENLFDDLKQLARQQFSSTVEDLGYKIDSDYMQRQLQTSVEELAYGFLQQAINSDPARPKVYRIVTPRRYDVRSGLNTAGGRFGFDNPDCIYRIVPVAQNFSYVIQGKGDGPIASDITISLHESFTGSTIALLAGEDIVRDEKGRFSVSIDANGSSSTPALNHIQSTPESKLLLIRHNIGDWLVESPDELLVRMTEMPEDIPFDSEGLPREATIELARGTLQKNIHVANFLLGKGTLAAPVNAMIPPTQSTKMGLATQALVLSHYSLGQSDALVITIEGGPSTYWNLGVYSLWMVTEDPRNRLVTLNNRQAVANRNGSYTFVLSATDPSIFNWLNTSSEGVGTIVARFQGLPLNGDALSKIKVWSHLCKLDQVHLSMPEDITYVSSTRRARQMESRAIGYDRIYSFDSTLPIIKRDCVQLQGTLTTHDLLKDWRAGGPKCSVVDDDLA